MKDASNFILQGIASLLVGNVEYDSTVVPFYALSQEPDETATRFVNVSSSYGGGDEGSKDGFMKPYTVNIDIVDLSTDGTLSERAVNAISSLVTQILIPSKGASGLSSDSEFSVVRTTVPRITPFTNRRDIYWHIRKVVEVEFLIQEL